MSAESGRPQAITSWDEVSRWWIQEVAEDPVYQEDVGPMFDRLLSSTAGPTVDLGCGEGQWLRRLGSNGRALGTDSSHSLLTRASRTAPVVRGVLPDLGWLRDGSVGTAISLFVFDLVDDHRRFLVEAARVVRPGGSFILIINHPVFTAPGSGPFMDPDFDVFWRWGSYLDPGSSDVPAGSSNIVMYHRSTAEILTSAADAGWSLEEMIEAPLGTAAIEREPLYAGQEGIPRFFGARWRC